MNILMISHEYPPVGGGGANACMNLAREYINQGHQVTILTVWYEGTAADEEKGALHIIRLKARRKHKEHCGFPEMMDYMLKAAWYGNGLLKKETFHVCQVFFAIPSGPVGYFLKKKYHIPYVVRVGGGDIPGFKERFQLAYKILAPFEKVIWRNADALVANSRGLKEFAEKFYNQCPVQIIPNGVSVAAFQDLGMVGTNKEKEVLAAWDGAAGTCLRILFVSRLIERKGLQHILPILPEVIQKTGKMLRLVIVGDGPYRPALEEIVREHHLEDVVHFTGQKEKGELSAYYNSADIFILPSRREGMPNVVLEAMAAGLPVLMTPCEGSEELIRGNGFAVPVEDFGEKLCEFAAKPELCRKMGAESLRLVSEEFTWVRTAAAYEGIFHKIMEMQSFR